MVACNLKVLLRLHRSGPPNNGQKEKDDSDDLNEFSSTAKQNYH